MQLRKLPSDPARTEVPGHPAAKDPHPRRGGGLRGGSIRQARFGILVIVLLVAASGLVYTPGLFAPSLKMRASRLPLTRAWGNMTQSVLTRFGVQQWRAEDGTDLNAILSERDAFLHRTRVVPSPPPPAARPRILAITPTYARAFQELYMTRLVNMIRQVAPPFLWIVIESPFKTEETASLLNRTADLCLPLGRPNCRRVEYVHIETGEVEKAKLNKAVVHRNRGLDYIEVQQLEGVIYFMDDDNSYAPQLFEELRKIQWVGVLPVGFLYTQEYSRRSPHLHNTPIVERPLVKSVGGSGKKVVYGWETFEWFVPKPGQKARMFNIDMAGFGFNSKALWAAPNANGYPIRPVRFQATHMGFLEDNFLLRLIQDKSELEPLGDGCSDVWVWHVHMEQESKFRYSAGWHLEQPDPHKLVRIQDSDHSAWPFVVNRTKVGIEGRGERGGLFIYS